MNTLSPGRKIEYLKEKLNIVQAEMRAVTGWPVSLSLHIYNGVSQSTEQVTAETIIGAYQAGFDRQRFSNQPKGGSWAWRDVGLEIVIYDDQMPDPPADESAPAYSEYTKLREQGLAEMDAIVGAGGLS